jgi:hypothetical protein
MSIITLKIAEEIAENLVKDREENIIILKENFKDQLTKIYKKTIPKIILDNFLNYNDYIYQTKTLKLYGYGWTGQYFTIKETLPGKSYAIVKTTEKEAELLMFKYNEYKKADDEKNKLYQELIILLRNLRTFKKASLEFSECIPYLPKNITNSLAININEIRKKIHLNKKI